MRASWILVGLLVAATLLGACPDPRAVRRSSGPPSTKLSDPEPMAVTGTWKHGPSGHVFLASAAGWERTNVDRYDVEANDIGVGYGLETPHGPALLTIYVFPPPRRRGVPWTLARHFAEERKNLQESFGGTEPLHLLDGADREAKLVEFELPPPMAALPTRRESLVLRESGSWRLKYRLSVAARARADALAALDALLEALSLPAAGLPGT